MVQLHPRLMWSWFSLLQRAPASGGFGRASGSDAVSSGVRLFSDGWDTVGFMIGSFRWYAAGERGVIFTLRAVGDRHMGQ
ncbi:hypothetical protein F4556_000808 [Kitasatospora gansuensis]|uniref:Uncharacterized protein n=1 Tax=Kitasatospora gansuensis TaxID=258050 RepID=A0A7W7S7F0_9ACTN|nr:hypothetical protein [Kitasatospora gansuensis]